MTLILRGTTARDSIRDDIKKTISGLQKKPGFVILQVGDRPDSHAYINQKKLFAEAVGARVVHSQFPITVQTEKILEEIKKYNADTSVHGILLQLPLPEHLDKELLLEAIDWRKDIDGLSSHNTKLLFDGKSGGHIPATARSIISLLDFYNIPIAGKKVVVVGRSTLVGKPAALALLNRDATVTIAHKETEDLASLTKSADILVIAIGNAQFIDKNYVSKGQVVVDVGINVTQTEDEKKKLLGDVNFADVEPLVAGISPVPGGVGPMTVASLFLNLIDSYTLLESET